MSIQFGSASAATGHIAQGMSPQVPSFPVTMSIWFYSNRTTGREPLLSFKCTDLDADGDAFELSLSMLSNAATTNRRVEAVVYDFWNSVVRAQTATGAGMGWSTNSWVHAAGTFNNFIRTPYLNGEPSGSNTVSINDPSESTLDPLVTLNGSVATSPSTIGHDAAGQVVLMAEAAIWDAVLEKEEIVALSRGAKPKTIRPDSLIFYSPLVRGSSSSVPDETGNIPLIAYNFASEFPPSYTDHTRRYG